MAMIFIFIFGCNLLLRELIPLKYSWPENVCEPRRLSYVLESLQLSISNNNSHVSIR